MILELSITALVASTLYISLVIYPLYKLHISTYKRRIISLLMILSTLNIFFAVFTYSFNLTLTAAFLLLILIIIFIVSKLLRRMDYYLEELLAELIILLFGLTAIILMLNIWDVLMTLLTPLFLMRGIVALIPLFLFAGKRMFVKNFGVMQAAIIYSILLITKWIIYPFFGVWSIVLIYIYSILAGYVTSWMINTSRAEKIFSLNISPEKIWMGLVLIAGLLVISF